MATLTLLLGACCLYTARALQLANDEAGWPVNAFQPQQLQSYVPKQELVVSRGAETQVSKVSKVSMGASDLERVTKLVLDSAVDVQNAASAAEILPLLANSTKLTTSSTGALREWRRAQRFMIEMTADIRAYCHWHSGARECRDYGNDALNPREWSAQGKRLADETFFEYFVERFQSDPNFYLGLVYIPLPWKFLIEDARRNLETVEPLRKAEHLMQNLDPKFKYFTVMEQAHVGGTEFWDVPWKNVLVFDSRGSDGVKWDKPRVAIPLLYGSGMEVTAIKNTEEKERRAFFAGHCRQRSHARDLLNPNSAALACGNCTIVWDIHACSAEKMVMPEHRFEENLRKSTWAITPTGSHPTSFMIYQALQGGTLPIIPYDTNGDGDPFLWLPYRDVGVHWKEDLTVQLPSSDIPHMKLMIEQLSATEVRHRQAMAQKYRALFTTEGLNAYVLYIVSKVRRVLELGTVLGLRESVDLATRARVNKRRKIEDAKGAQSLA